MSKLLPFLILFWFPVLVDQSLKYTVVSENLFYYKNPGIVFGVFNGPYALLLATAAIVLLAIPPVIARCHDPWQSLSRLSRGAGSRFATTSLNTRNDIGLILFLSGALSNLVDRLSRGFVIDYLDWKTLLPFWPENFVRYFNLADVFIVVGLILVGIRLTRRG